jgi:molybdate transport system ATP-binding protein
LSAPALEIHLARRVHPALKLDVRLNLGRECGVVFGPSGAGKTTLLRLIAGLDTPNQGFVRLDGETLFDSQARVYRPLRVRRVGMVFQDDLLFPHRNVALNIGFGLNGWTRSEAAKRGREVAALCGVDHLLRRQPSTLSGGERQRVGLARALAPHPRLLLCDEPVSALDLANRHILIDRLRAVQAVEKIPVLYVTHSPAEAIALGSTLFLLENGRIAAEGPPLAVLTSRPDLPGRLEGVRNVFAGQVDGQNGEIGETVIRLLDGPVVIVPFLDRPAGTCVEVEVLAEEILLARAPVGGLSARNVIEGLVERVHPHGADAEVVVRTGGVRWIVSVVATAVDALELQSCAGVHMIIKARSCHVRVRDEPSA